jgi:glycosyltransferase involved in cell wall biosynthesis
VCNYEFPPLGGGAAPVARDIAVTLVSMGHEVDVVTMGFRGLAKQEEPMQGLRVFRVPCWRRREYICSTAEMATFLLPALAKCVWLHRRTRYDVCHAHFIFPSGVVAWQLKALTRLPYVITCHGSDVPGYNPDRFGMEHRLLLPLWRTVVRRAAAATFPSVFLRDLFLVSARRFPPLEIIPNGVDADHYEPTRHEPKILFVGRLVPRKGAQILLDALVGVELPNWEVHVVGDGPMREEVEQVAGRLKMRAFVHGWIERGSPRLQELWRSASIFVLPSLMENFPVVVLEAMASSMAVVTTNVGGTAEVVGDAGVLVEPGDQGALREAVVSLACDEGWRRRLGAAARERVEGLFAWPVVAKKYAQVLESAARRDASA